MSALSFKSADEISHLLDDYGIRHGPVVDSTRGLYEKKLREAMASEKEALKQSPDCKTYYREDGVTDVTHRLQVRNDGGLGNGPCANNVCHSSSAAQSDTRRVPRWVKFLVFLVMAVILYYVFSELSSSPLNINIAGSEGPSKGGGVGGRTGPV